MKKQKFRKTQLSLALTTALSGGLLASGPAQAVVLDGNDRLGDAGIFQYYTVQAGWQTFFRIINTSEDVVSVKLRFHEAANSREVLDFFVLLSPYDMWSAWTSTDAVGNRGNPGIRTNDKSCLVPWVDQGINLGQGWQWIDEATGLKGAPFQSTAFEDPYNDHAEDTGKTKDMRLAEGWLEVIGIAKHGHDSTSNFVQDVKLHTPESCLDAADLFANQDVFDYDLGNVLGFNGYLINVAAGQGGGYDPDVLADFASKSLVWLTGKSDTQPNLDSGDTDGFAYGGYEKVAINQWDGSGNPATATVYQVDINGNGDWTDTVYYAINGICTEVDEANAPVQASVGNMTLNVDLSDDIGQDCYESTNASSNNATYNSDFNVNTDHLTPNGLIWTPASTTASAIAGPEYPARIAQRGVWGPAPVRGSVDAVSWELQRKSVINEWAASYSPANTVSDYFTQWVLTFPTKNFYVDLQDAVDDPLVERDYSPTLQDIKSDYAFAPFIEKFPENGESCVPFRMDMWDRDEGYKGFTSPSGDFNQELCYEANVVSFDGNNGRDYGNRGLDSNFGITIPYGLLPPKGQRGWAQMTFLNPEGLLMHPSRYQHVVDQKEMPEFFKVRYGLPVTGFLFSVYNTNATENNHAAINVHKYTRKNGCYFQSKGRLAVSKDIHDCDD
jgi:hypothetical protein